MNAPLPPPTSPTLRGLFDIKVFLETGQSRKSGEAGQAEVFPPEKNAAKNKSKKLVKSASPVPVGLAVSGGFI